MRHKQSSKTTSYTFKYGKTTRSRKVVLQSLVYLVVTGTFFLLIEPPPTVAQTSLPTFARNSPKGDVPVKWLPDLRVLSGAPPTTIDLEPALQEFCNEGYFKREQKLAPNDLKCQVSENIESDNVADLTLEGTQLHVKWKNKTVDSQEVVVKVTLKEDDGQHAFISFKATSWSPNYGQILLIVLGGLGLFILGMKKTSDGLQALAGARLRRLVSLFTNNRFLAIGVGVLSTTLVQSSSATSVMTLGFVNSGLMTLSQAVGVIIGTNIGTTTTGWILALDVGEIGLPLLGIAALFLIFSPKERIRNLATLGLGLGMIFFGLETMKNGLAPLPEIPQFSLLIQTFRADSLLGVGKCVVVGCLATFLVQSSAATLAIVITLAFLNVVDLNTAAAIVLGSNIGTTITALLASVSVSINAKRVAYFHLLFNVIGVAWAWAIFFIALMPTVNGMGDAFNMDVSGKIALTHTLFNVVNTILFLPFTRSTARFLERFVKESNTEDKTNKTSVTGLSVDNAIRVGVAIERSRAIVLNMFTDCYELIYRLYDANEAAYERDENIEKAFDVERKLDAVKEETIDYISYLTPFLSSSDSVNSAREQIRLAQELETVSDYLTGILKSNLKLKEANVQTPKILKDAFHELFTRTVDSLLFLKRNFEQRRHSHLVEPTRTLRSQFVDLVKNHREKFMQTMFREEQTPLAIVAVDYQLNAWRRIYEHLQNIAEAMEAQNNLKRSGKEF